LQVSEPANPPGAGVGWSAWDAGEALAGRANAAAPPTTRLIRKKHKKVNKEFLLGRDLVLIIFILHRY
jgi:hypothetical protein